MSGRQAGDNPGLCPGKGKNLVFLVGLGPEISLLLYQMLVIHTVLYLSFIFCLETPKNGLGPTNFLFPHTPACPGTEYTPTICQVEIPFNTFWHCHTNGGVILAACSAFRAV
jgi:hypothetical protein